MADILRSSVINATASRTILEKTPFWPVTWIDENGDVLARFNPGFLIDYQNQTGTKIEKNTQKVLRPVNMDTNFNVTEGGNIFYLKVKTSGNDATPEEVEIMQVLTSPASVDQWHFGSINVEDDGYIADGEDEFRIPMCVIDKSNGSIKEVCLRENIHYQQFHMENVGGGARVLKTIGEEPENYGQNPSTKYRSITGIDPVIVEEGEDEITISVDLDKISETSAGYDYLNENKTSISVNTSSFYKKLNIQAGDNIEFDADAANLVIQLADNINLGCIMAHYVDAKYIGSNINETILDSSFNCVNNVFKIQTGISDEERTYQDTTQDTTPNTSPYETAGRIKIEGDKLRITTDDGVWKEITLTGVPGAPI